MNLSALFRGAALSTGSLSQRYKGFLPCYVFLPSSIHCRISVTSSGFDGMSQGINPALTFSRIRSASAETF